MILLTEQQDQDQSLQDQDQDQHQSDTAVRIIHVLLIIKTVSFQCI